MGRRRLMPVSVDIGRRVILEQPCAVQRLLSSQCYKRIVWNRAELCSGTASKDRLPCD